MSLTVRAAAKLRRLAPRPALYWPGGVVSFSFDDFPRSALRTGGRILEDHGARGTYYVAMGLAGTDGALGPLFDLDDLHAAHERGHELGCHTFGHLNCGQAEGPAIVYDVAANAARLAELFDGFSATSFAYPFGAVSPAAKRVLRRRFATCRGIQPGLNRRGIDLAELRANKIYADRFDGPALKALIDRNAAAGGWLIFYTHDVSQAPSPYGCRPEQLAAVAGYAARRSTILPIGEVARHVRKGW